MVRDGKHERTTRTRLIVITAAVSVVVAVLATVMVLRLGAPAPSPAARPSTEPTPFGSGTVDVGGSPPASPSAAVSPSPTPSRSVPASPARVPARIPAQVVNLANWKLTLPIAKPGSSKAQEILQPQLSSYSIAPYFAVDPAGDGIVFQANAGGATTSGSGYPRSELREMSGGTEASWSTDSGTSTMTVRAAVTHLTSVKPQVTVAQVHDGSDDVLVIRLDGPHHLYAEHNGTDYGDIDNNYVLGTPFTAQLTASGGHIRISYNGVPKVDYAHPGSGNYFKAGCYTQSNTDKGDAPDAYAQVVIYRLTVAHG